MKVLVVDDSAVVRRLVTARLEADGHEVAEAADGIEGLEAARAEPPDLVVLDRSMPRMDGFEVCTRLRENAATAEVAILMLTDSSGEQALAEGIERGADDFMSKPFSPRELSLRVRLLGTRRAPR
jgi:DNA-binding response OmpR family regulator